MVQFLEWLAGATCFGLFVYKWIIIAAVVMTWVSADPHNQIVQWIGRVTRPLWVWCEQRMPVMMAHFSCLCLNSGGDICPDSHSGRDTFTELVYSGTVRRSRFTAAERRSLAAGYKYSSAKLVVFLHVCADCLVYPGISESVFK